jgi:hypothetical protein
VDGTSQIGLAVISDRIHLKRQSKPVLFPDVEGLVYFMKKYFLYYATADSKISVAVGYRQRK